MRLVKAFAICITAITLSHFCILPDANAGKDTLRKYLDNSNGTVTLEASRYSGSSAGGAVPSGVAESRQLTFDEIRQSRHLFENPAEVGLPSNTTYTFGPPRSRLVGGQEAEAAAVERAIASLQIPETQLVFGPEPSVNEWNAIPVNFPIWLNLANKAPVSTKVVEGSFEITLNARLANTYWQMGDGASFSCKAMANRFPKVQNPPLPSPNCGYTYKTPNNYQVSAIAVWQVEWSVNGKTGVTNLARAATRPLKINELRSLITR